MKDGAKKSNLYVYGKLIASMTKKNGEIIKTFFADTEETSEQIGKYLVGEGRRWGMDYMCPIEYRKHDIKILQWKEGEGDPEMCEDDVIKNNPITYKTIFNIFLDRLFESNIYHMFHDITNFKQQTAAQIAWNIKADTDDTESVGILEIAIY